jgi:hypothetical protein
MERETKAAKLLMQARRLVGWAVGAIVQTRGTGSADLRIAVGCIRPDRNLPSRREVSPIYPLRAIASQTRNA